MPSKIGPALRSAFLIACVCAGAALLSQPAPREQVGPLPGGGFLLNSGWKLQPVGKQIAVDTFPMATALSPDGKRLLVLNGGWKPPSISVLDAVSGAVVSTTPIPDGWLGLTFAPRSNKVYVGGGSKAAVFEFTLSSDKLEADRTFPAPFEEKQTDRDFIGDVAFSPDGRLL
ncbi:MAG TPA: hypothetical protein VH475_08625, partial [Tepidisphaeraceae bacterium]